MKTIKKVLLSVLALSMSIPGICEKTDTSGSVLKKADFEEKYIDRGLFEDYVDIQPEGVSFNKDEFDENVMILIKDELSEEDYECYEAQCAYVETTALAMTELASQGEGTIDSDGTFNLSKDVTKEIVSLENVEKEVENVVEQYPEIEEKNPLSDWLDELLTQPFIKEFSWNFWDGFDILFEPSGTMVMGLCGIVTNIVGFALSLSGTIDLSHSPKEILTEGINGNPTLFRSDLDEISNYIANNARTIQESVAQDIVCVEASEICDCLSCFLSYTFACVAVSDLMVAHPAYWIIRTILTILSLYLPDFLTGIVMFISGMKFIDYRAKIGFLWGIYSAAE